MHLQIVDVVSGKETPVAIHFHHDVTAAKPTSSAPHGVLTDMTICSVHKGPCQFAEEGKGKCIAFDVYTSQSIRNPKDAPNRVAARKQALARTIKRMAWEERKQIWEQYFKISPKSKS